MKCPNCGTENEITSNRKFCVKCGTNLINPDEVNIEQVDFGGYHNEENKDNFKIGQETFRINDKTPQTDSMFVSSEELNQSYDDFDDEPYIPQLDSERVRLPEQPENPPIQPEPENNNNMYPQQNNAMYPQGMNPYMQNMYGYGQPVTQFVGYDANGMPMYAQVMMIPQFVGYDMNGMPVYMPMPVYPQGFPNMQNPQMFPNNMQVQQNMQNPQMFPTMQPQQNMQNPQMFPNNMQVQPNMQNPQMFPNNMQVQQNVQNPSPPRPPEPKEKEPLWSDFLEEDVKKSAQNDSQKKAGSDDDFFSKPRNSNSGISAEGSERRKSEKQNKYMASVPEADASRLAPNVNKGNGKYMKSTAVVNADDLEQNVTKKSKAKMKSSLKANPDELEHYVRKTPEVIMDKTKKADADELQAYKHEHVESIMKGADKAVEAMPKKKVYVDELEQIELPEHMKAKKSKKKSTEIPSLPDI